MMDRNDAREYVLSTIPTEYQADYDVDAIIDAAFSFDAVDGYAIAVSGDEYWQIVAAHDESPKESALIIYQPVTAPYSYNVVICKNNVYSGEGKYFTNLADAQDYAFNRVGQDAVHHYNTVTRILN